MFHVDRVNLVLVQLQGQWCRWEKNSKDKHVAETGRICIEMSRV